MEKEANFFLPTSKNLHKNPVVQGTAARSPLMMFYRKTLFSFYGLYLKQELLDCCELCSVCNVTTHQSLFGLHGLSYSFFTREFKRSVNNWNKLCYFNGHAVTNSVWIMPCALLAAKSEYSVSPSSLTVEMPPSKNSVQ